MARHFTDPGQASTGVSYTHFRAATPCSSPKEYEYSQQGWQLEKSGSPSLWKDSEDLADRKNKRRRLRYKEEKCASSSSSSSSLLDQLDEDTRLHLLSFLDFQSLIRCLTVGSSLRNLIRSSEFRRLWSDNQPPAVLLGSSTLPCKLWIPGTDPTIFRPLSTVRDSLVVASDRGLVCIRFKEAGRHGVDLAVGNPLTGEWVALPRLTNNDLFRFTLEVRQAGDVESSEYSVDFKVAAMNTSNNRHICYFFDSATADWSSTCLFFPPRTAFKWSTFDLQSSTWTAPLFHRWEIKTGLERSPAEVHRLPHPSLHGFCHWEYGGSTYFAAAWTVEQTYYDDKKDGAGEFAGYGVWKVVKNSKLDGRLETVAAVWGPEVGASLAAILANVWLNMCSVTCSASENLVCFYGESSLSPFMPVVVYDIMAGKWTVYDEQHQTPGEHDQPDNYNVAAIYSPSLFVTPHQ